MAELFPSTELGPAEPTLPGPGLAQAGPDGAAGAVVSLAMNAGVWRTFDYLWPAEWPEPKVGQRVRAPFGRGNRTVLAFVAAVGQAQFSAPVFRSFGSG